MIVLYYYIIKLPSFNIIYNLGNIALVLYFQDYFGVVNGTLIYVRLFKAEFKM